MAGEQISVTKPPARERALQKLDALGVGWEIFEGHGIFSVRLKPALSGHRAKIDHDNGIKKLQN
jgi:hypothetical protein